MARIAGVDIPSEKRILISLTYIYGIGRTTSQKILDAAGVDSKIRTHQLSNDDIAKIRKVIDATYKVEGDLRFDVKSNIKRLMDIGCYRGLRHRKSLPVRGQRTRTNARTRKGPRGATVAKKKQVSK